jgi:hypothetical protein
LEQARQCAAEGRQALRKPTPENLDACRGRLERAAEHLAQAIQGLLQGGSAELAALAALNGEIAATASLLNVAGAMMAGWADRLGALAGGYTADGRPGQWQPRQRMAVEG